MTHTQEELEGKQYSLTSCRLADFGAWGHLGMEGVLRGQWQQGLSYS